MFHSWPPAMVIGLVATLAWAAVIAGIGIPFARAWARRIENRGNAPVPPDVSQRLARIEAAVDTIALEVERISEGQRFATRLLSEQRDASAGLTAGA